MMQNQPDQRCATRSAKVFRLATIALLTVLATAGIMKSGIARAADRSTIAADVASGVPVGDIIRKAIAENLPLDAIVRALVSANVPVETVVYVAIAEGVSASAVVACGVQAGGDLTRVMNAAKSAGASDAAISSGAVIAGASPAAVASALSSMTSSGSVGAGYSAPSLGASPLSTFTPPSSGSPTTGGGGGGGGGLPASPTKPAGVGYK